MKETINTNSFIRAFEDYDRRDQFTENGLIALFDYIEDIEDDCGEEIELDVIALCCEFSEYDNLEEFWNDYSKEEYPDLDTLRDYTQLIEVGQEGGFIIQSF